MNFIILLAITIVCVLLKDVDSTSNGGVWLPPDVLGRIMPFTHGYDQLKLVNRNSYGVYAQAMDTLTPLLMKMVDQGLNDAERAELATLYEDLDLHSKTDLLSRVPGIIKGQIQPTNRDLLSVSTKVEELKSYFNFTNRTAIAFDYSFEMLKLYIMNDPQLEWFLIFYRSSIQRDDSLLFAGPVERQNRLLFYWNNVSIKPLDRSFEEACNWYRQGYETLQPLFRREVWARQQDQYDYLREVWFGRHIKFEDNKPNMTAIERKSFTDIVFITRSLFRKAVITHIQWRYYDKLKKFLVELKQRGLLVLLERTWLSDGNDKSFIPKEVRVEKDKWKKICWALSPLLEEYTDVDAFTDASFQWQTQKFTDVVHYYPKVLIRKYYLLYHQPF